MVWKRVRRPLLRALFRERWSRLSLDEVVARFGSPARVDDYMQTCFDYVLDEDLHGHDEYWQDPHTTHALKRGDCEDWAVFAWHVLAHHGYEASVFAAFRGDVGHAVCLVREGDVWVSLSNEGLKRLGRVRLSRRVAQEQAEGVVARFAAECIYPGRWTSCAFVRRWTRGAAEGCPSGFCPVYEWVRP